MVEMMTRGQVLGAQGVGIAAGGISVEEYDRLVAAIYRAGLDASAWSDFVTALDRQIDGAYLSLYGYDTRLSTTMDLITSGYTPDQIDSYQLYYHRRNPFLAGLASAAPMDVRTTDGYIDRETFLQSEFLNGFLSAEEHVGAGAGGTILNDDGRMLVLCGHVRFRDEDTKVPRLMELIRLLGPHVGRAFGIGRRLGNQAITGAACEAVLDRVGNSVLVLDGRGRPLFANAAARQRMAASRAMGLDRDGALSFRNTATQAAFHAGLARLLRADDTRLPGPFGVELDDGMRVAATLDPFRIAETDSHPWTHPPAALLSLSDQSLDRVRTEQRLAALYGLTAAERRLVMHVAEDRSLSDVSDLTGVSMHTLRSQLKSVYGKTGINRQSQLTGLVHRMAV
ncbi:helix-turn-helix transcriptional regulator [Marinibacterium sp. SX1]|uniref:helix-turn-helix transcriptional regulator n=1 Tax=Marinibacterium sp. SX1 TaxID=3388424 RepID=UPI003D16D9DF